MVVMGINTIWNQDIKLLDGWFFFLQVDMMIWKVDKIIWQVMPEICYYNTAYIKDTKHI